MKISFITTNPKKVHQSNIHLMLIDEEEWTIQHTDIQEHEIRFIVTNKKTGKKACLYETWSHSYTLKTISGVPQELK